MSYSPPRRKKVTIARSPEGKVTTINVQLGERGVRYGWDYTICNVSDLPEGRPTQEAWDRVIAIPGTVVRTSMHGREKITVEQVGEENQRVLLHLHNLEYQRQIILSRLDIEYLRAMELWTSQRLRAVVRFKRALRDWKVEVDDFGSVQEFVDYWPELFDKTVEEYIPGNWPIIAGLTFVVAMSAATAYMMMFM